MAASRKLCIVNQVFPPPPPNHHHKIPKLGYGTAFSKFHATWCYCDSEILVLSEITACLQNKGLFEDWLGLQNNDTVSTVCFFFCSDISVTEVY